MSDNEAKMARAMSSLQKGLTFREGAPGLEQSYGEAYDNMVRDGEALPLRRKYRVGKHHKKVRK